MNTFFLHVGPHKTGTTMIQKFLLDNRAMLFKDNLVYPKRFQSIFGHHDLRPTLLEKRLTDEDVTFFDEAHDFLLSSEDFISLDQQHFEYLQSRLESKQIVILFSWRRASLKLYSIWQETIKHGGTDSFFAYYHNHIARPAQSQMLSADLKLNMFAHVFGKQNVRILDYDAAARNKDLLKQFCSMINIDWRDDFIVAEDNKEARNQSMDITDIEAIRALNYYFKSQWGITGATVRNLYVKNLNALDSHGLHELKAIISESIRVLTVGNYFIDNRGEKVMRERYSDNMINYEPNGELQSVRMATEDWLLTPRSQSLIKSIAEFLKESHNV